MSWKQNNGRDRGHIDGIGYFLKGPNNSNINSIEPSGNYVSAITNEAGVTTVFLNVPYPMDANNVLSSDICGNLSWIDMSGSGSWVGTATSGLNMNTFAITDASMSNPFVIYPTANGEVLTGDINGKLSWTTNSNGWVGTAATPLNMNNYDIANASMVNPFITVPLEDGQVLTGNIDETLSWTTIPVYTGTDPIDVSGTAISLKTGDYLTTGQGGNLTMNITNSPTSVGQLLSSAGVGNGAMAWVNTPTVNGQVLTGNTNGTLAWTTNSDGWVDTAASDLSMNNFAIKDASMSNPFVTAPTANGQVLTGNTDGTLAWSSNTDGWVDTATSDLSMNNYAIKDASMSNPFVTPPSANGQVLTGNTDGTLAWSSNTDGWVDTATSDLNMATYAITDASMSNPFVTPPSANGQVLTGNTDGTLAWSSNTDGWVDTATSDLNMAGYFINNVNTITANPSGSDSPIYIFNVPVGPMTEPRDISLQDPIEPDQFEQNISYKDLSGISIALPVTLGGVFTGINVDTFKGYFLVVNDPTLINGTKYKITANTGAYSNQYFTPQGYYFAIFTLDKPFVSTLQPLPFYSGSPFTFTLADYFNLYAPTAFQSETLSLQTASLYPQLNINSTTTTIVNSITTNDNFIFQTSGITFPDSTIQATAYNGNNDFKYQTQLIFFTPNTPYPAYTPPYYPQSLQIIYNVISTPNFTIFSVIPDTGAFPNYTQLNFVSTLQIEQAQALNAGFWTFVISQNNVNYTLPSSPSSFSVNFLDKTTGYTALGLGTLSQNVSNINMNITFSSVNGTNYNTGDQYIIQFPNTFSFYSP